MLRGSRAVEAFVCRQVQRKVQVACRWKIMLPTHRNRLKISAVQALRKVIIPEILPGMISGFMLAITMSIDDFAVTIFTIGNEGLETLSTFIYADARKGGLTPELRPLSTIIFVLVLVMLIIINRRSEKNKKK